MTAGPTRCWTTIRRWSTGGRRTRRSASSRTDGVLVTRSGDARMEISAIQILDMDGQPGRVFKTGETARIRQTITCNDPTVRPNVGILIRDRLGNHVYGTNTHLKKSRSTTSSRPAASSTSISTCNSCWAAGRTTSRSRWWTTPCTAVTWTGSIRRSSSRSCPKASRTSPASPRCRPASPMRPALEVEGAEVGEEAAAKAHA